MAQKGWEGKHFNSGTERFVGFKTLGFQALPELWTFQSVVGFVLAAVLGVSNRITDILVNSLGVAIYLCKLDAAPLYVARRASGNRMDGGSANYCGYRALCPDIAVQ